MLQLWSWTGQRRLRLSEICEGHVLYHVDCVPCRDWLDNSDLCPLYHGYQECTHNSSMTGLDDCVPSAEDSINVVKISYGRYHRYLLKFG